MNRPYAMCFLLISIVVCYSSCTSSDYPRQLAYEYGDLRTILAGYADDKKLPPVTLAETMREWEKMPQGTPFSVYVDSSHFRWLRTGNDPWASPFVFHVDAEKKIVTIRSLGPNRRDERGAGDDIENRFDLSTQAASRLP